MDEVKKKVRMSKEFSLILKMILAFFSYELTIIIHPTNVYYREKPKSHIG